MSLKNKTDFPDINVERCSEEYLTPAYRGGICRTSGHSKTKRSLKSSLQSDEGTSKLELLKNILVLVVPSFCSLVLADLVWQFTIVIAGRTGVTQNLAGIGMVSNINMVFPVVICFGTSRALGTFVSQAYGAKNYERCAELSNKHMIVITLAFIPMVPILWNIGKMLAYIGIHPHAAYVAGQYSKILAWGFYMDCLFQSMRMYLTNVQNATTPMIIQLITIAIHPLWVWIFFKKLEYGIYGLAIAQNVTYTLQFIIIQLYMRLSSNELNQKLICLPSLRSFEDFGTFLNLARYTLLQEFLEVGAYETIAIMSGFLTVKMQAANAIVWALTYLIIYVPYSFQMTIGALVGEALGQQNVKKAKDTFKMIFYVTTIGSGILMTCFYVYAQQITSLYDTDIEVQKYATEGMRSFILCSFPPMFITLMFLGMINAVGVQAETQNPAIFAYIFVCIPTAWVLTFKFHLGIAGLFFGMGTGQLLLSLLYMKIVYCIDWDKQVKFIKEQAEQEEKKLQNDQLNYQTQRNDDEEREGLLSSQQQSSKASDQQKPNNLGGDNDNEALLLEEDDSMNQNIVMMEDIYILK